MFFLGQYANGNKHVNMKILFVLPQMILCCSVVVQVTHERGEASFFDWW
jgi:hypothetical protein